MAYEIKVFSGRRNTEKAVASAGNAADGSERPVRTAKQQWKGLKSFFFSSQHGWGKADAGSNLRVENTVMVRDPASNGGGTPKWVMGQRRQWQRQRQCYQRQQPKSLCHRL